MDTVTKPDRKRSRRFIRAAFLNLLLP